MPVLLTMKSLIEVWGCEHSTNRIQGTAILWLAGQLYCLDQPEAMSAGLASAAELAGQLGSAAQAGPDLHVCAAGAWLGRHSLAHGSSLGRARAMLSLLPSLLPLAVSLI